MRKLLTLLALTILAITSSRAQSDSLSSPIPYFSAIIVSDIDSSILWYETILKFKLQNQTALESRGIRQANLAGESAALELIEMREVVFPEEVLQGELKGQKLGGFFKLGFAVSDFENWLHHLERSRVKFQGSVVTDPVTNKKMIIIKDPDGNRIQIFEQ